MTITVTHAKTNSITDWTQAELDAQIALGNYPPGTLLADIVLPSDWNDGHTITGLGTAAASDTGDFATAAQGALADSALQPNTPITGATKTKITYDSDGLVTAGADATTADIADSTNKRYVTDAQLTVLGNTSGTNTGDQDLSGYATTAAVAAGYQPLASVLTNTTASFTTAQETKLSGIETGATADQVASEVPVTATGNLASTNAQAALEELQGDIDTINSSLGGLTDAVVLRGTWDASAGTFPGSGSAQAGWSYIVSVAGTVGGIAFVENDRLLAITDNASTTTYASNWHKLDYTDQVLSVNSQTGTVVLDADDIDDTATTNKFTTASDISKLAGIEAGADVTDTANVTAAGALMDSEVTNLAAVKAFDPTDYATAAQGALADTATQPGDLATVATSGAYGDLSGTPTIPSAIFSTISVSGQSDVVADSATDTLTLAAGTGITITTNATTDTVTITNSGSAPAWGGITGTLSDQTDLQSALDAKANAADYSNVTNNAQTQAAIVPNTAPSAGQILVGNAGNTAYAPATVSGSGATISLASTGVVTISSIANASLTNSAITIAGTSTALGGSIARDTITGVSSNGLLARTAANTLTNRTITGGGGISVNNGDGVSGNPTLGVSALQSIWIPASAMWPSNSGGCGALAQQTVGVNRPDIKYLPFDPTSVESAEFTIAFPKGWNEGTVTAQFYWTHPSTATNFGCIWSLQGVALSNDDPHDTTWGAQQQVTDTGGTTYDVYISDATSAITIAGTPAAGDICYMHLLRRAADGGDTLAVDAWLIGVKLFYTIDTLDDT